MNSGDINENPLLKIHTVYKELDPIVPPSLRLADAIKAAVLQGDLAPGDPVPSTTAIAKQLGINQMTAIKALQKVASLEIIKHHRGTNYVVCEAAREICSEIVTGEILGELRYLYRKMMNYRINRNQIIQWLKGYEDADKDIERMKES